MEIDAGFKAWIAPMLAPLPELPDGMYYMIGWKDLPCPAVYCSCCEELFEWPLGVDEWTEEEANADQYCGRSPRCCP